MKYTWTKKIIHPAGGARDWRTSASWADGAAATDGGRRRRRRSDDLVNGGYHRAAYYLLAMPPELSHRTWHGRTTNKMQTAAILFYVFGLCCWRAAERFYDALIKPGVVASAGQIQLRVLRLLHAGL